MLTQEQEIKLECLKLLIQSGVKHDQLEEVATSLSRWILMNGQTSLLNTEYKEIANTFCPFFAALELVRKMRCDP